MLSRFTDYSPPVRIIPPYCIDSMTRMLDIVFRGLYKRELRAHRNAHPDEALFGIERAATAIRRRAKRETKLGDMLTSF